VRQRGDPQTGMILRGPEAFLVTFCSRASLRRLCSFTRGVLSTTVRFFVSF
jgi:hypothetical protein